MADSSDPLNWTVLLPVVAGGLAVWYMLPAPARRPAVFGALGGLIALAGVAAFLIRGLGSAVPQTVEAGLFFGFAGVAILFAGLMITNRNPARSALCFALVVLSTCGLFLLLAAPFLSAATIIIYAGAIIVTFLFVIMLSHQEGPSNADLRTREPALAAAAGFVLLATLLVGLQKVYDYRSVDAAIDHADRLARPDVDLAEYLSPPNPAPQGGPLTTKAADFITESRAALDRVRTAAPRDGAADREFTDHPLVEEVDTAIKGLEVYGFRHADGDEVRVNARKVRDRLRRLKQLRDGTAGFDDVAVSNHGVVKLVGDGPRRLPAANVSAVGRTLFTDHLLAVELAGTLLLVATVGAIAIAGGRREKLA